MLEKATAPTPTCPRRAARTLTTTASYRAARRGAGAMAHVPGTELHHILDAPARIVTGGRILRPAAGGGSPTIQGGETRRVAKGDVILIPEARALVQRSGKLDHVPRSALQVPVK